MDDSPEAALALRFAARRAARTGGGVMVLAIVPPQDFLAFGGVQATIEADAREQAEALAATAAEAVSQEANVTPKILVNSAPPAAVAREVICASDAVQALGLAPPASGAPTQRHAHFTRHAEGN